MISKFNDFVNEARSNFPLYKVGDDVLVIGYHEFQYSSVLPVKRWETYSKYATYSETGIIGKIAEVDTAKKEYVLEATGGILKTVYRGRSNGSYRGITKDTKIYLRVKQAQLTTENLSAVQKLLKEDQFSPGEKVSARVSGEKTVTRNLVGVSIYKTIENKKLSYILEGVNGVVTLDRIEKEIDTNDETAQQFLAEEIAKILGSEVVETTGSGLNKDFVYKVAKLEGKGMVDGILFFKDDDEREKFVEDLQKFIDKRLDENLQKVMNGGESSAVKVVGISSTMSRWYKGKISAQKLFQAARNLGINVKEFFEKKRGAIVGKKYDL